MWICWTHSNERDLLVPLTPSARRLWVDHVVEDGALLPKQVAPAQLEARRLGAPLDQAVDQVDGEDAADDDDTLP